MRGYGVQLPCSCGERFDNTSNVHTKRAELRQVELPISFLIWKARVEILGAAEALLQVSQMGFDRTSRGNMRIVRQ
jgi:hypothetical protein